MNFSLEITMKTDLSTLPKVKYIICDIAKKKSLKKNIRKPFTYVVNLGGYVDHTNRKKVFKSHYIGCKNLAEIFLKKMPIDFVQMGSGAEYGDVKSPHKQNATCNPKSVYGQAKLMSSIYLIDLFKKHKFYRHFNYGHFKFNSR